MGAYDASIPRLLGLGNTTLFRFGNPDPAILTAVSVKLTKPGAGGYNSRYAHRLPATRAHLRERRVFPTHNSRRNG
jgi:hypothetical protein